MWVLFTPLVWWHACRVECVLKLQLNPSMSPGELCPNFLIRFLMAVCVSLCLWSFVWSIRNIICCWRIGPFEEKAFVFYFTTTPLNPTITLLTSLLFSVALVLVLETMRKPNPNCKQNATSKMVDSTRHPTQCWNSVVVLTAAANTKQVRQTNHDTRNRISD